MVRKLRGLGRQQKLSLTSRRPQSQNTRMGWSNYMILRRLLCGLSLALVVVFPVPSKRSLTAQDIPRPAPDSLALTPISISPTGAMLRSILVPGWGHASIGSLTRGGFYFGFQAVTTYTFLRTRTRLSEVRARVAHREMLVRADLAHQGITDPVEVDRRLEEDAILKNFEPLAKSREGQQEDLVAFGIFLMLLAGADAYVSTHLSRFPAPIDLQTGYSSDGRAEVALRWRLPD